MGSRGFQGKFMVAGKGRLRGKGGVGWWTDAFDHQPSAMQIQCAVVRRRRARSRVAKASRKRNR